MREFLEDANEHREDGYGRAQAHVKQRLAEAVLQGSARCSRSMAALPSASTARVPQDARE